MFTDSNLGTDSAALSPLPLPERQWRLGGGASLFMCGTLTIVVWVGSFGLVAWYRRQPNWKLITMAGFIPAILVCLCICPVTLQAVSRRLLMGTTVSPSLQHWKRRAYFCLSPCPCAIFLSLFFAIPLCVALAMGLSYVRMRVNAVTVQTPAELIDAATSDVKPLIYINAHLLEVKLRKDLRQVYGSATRDRFNLPGGQAQGGPHIAAATCWVVLPLNVTMRPLNGERTLDSDPSADALTLLVAWDSYHAQADENDDQDFPCQPESASQAAADLQTEYAYDESVTDGVMALGFREMAPRGSDGHGRPVFDKDGDALNKAIDQYSSIGSESGLKPLAEQPVLFVNDHKVAMKASFLQLIIVGAIAGGLWVCCLCALAVMYAKDGRPWALCQGRSLQNQSTTSRSSANNTNDVKIATSPKSIRSPNENDSGTRRDDAGTSEEYSTTTSQRVKSTAIAGKPADHDVVCSSIERDRGVLKSKLHDRYDVPVRQAASISAQPLCPTISFSNNDEDLDKVSHVAIPSNTASIRVHGRRIRRLPPLSDPEDAGAATTATCDSGNRRHRRHRQRRARRIAPAPDSDRESEHDWTNDVTSA